MTTAEDKARTKRTIVIIVVGLLVVAVLLVERLFGGGGDDSNRAPEPDDSPSVVESTDPATVPPAAADREAAEESAERAVRAYTEYSWKDPQYNSWQTRLAKVTTANYMKSLRAQFPSGPEAKSDWGREVIEPKRETRTKVDEIAFVRSGDEESDDEHAHFDDSTTSVTFVVSYTTSVRAFDTDGWTEPVESLYKEVVVVKVNGKWLVNGMRDTTDGGNV